MSFPLWVSVPMNLACRKISSIPRSFMVCFRELFTWWVRLFWVISGLGFS